MNDENQTGIGGMPIGDPPEAPAPAAVATATALAEGPAADAPDPVPPKADDPSATIRETVLQTLSVMGISAEGAGQRNTRELENAVAILSRLPDELRSRTESMFASVLERIEDPKGYVAFNQQKRLFLGMLSIHDLIRDLEKGAAENGTAEPHASNYQNLRDQLLQVLAMNNVTPIICQIGVPFNPQQNRVVRVAPTDDAALDGCIASVVREGFVCGSFVVRPAEVVVQKRSAVTAEQAQ